jgi:hypothetical protein
VEEEAILLMVEEAPVDQGDEEPVEDELAAEEPEMDEEMSRTLAAAIRAPQRGELEEILASNLAAALFSPPLEKIRMILEAFMLLPSEEQEALFDEDARQTIYELYQVAVSLSNVVEVPPGPYRAGRYAAIPWSFSCDQAWQYLRHFVTSIWEFFPHSEAWQQFFARVKSRPEGEEGTMIWYQYLNYLAWYLCSGEALLHVVEEVKNQFITRAMPSALNLMRVIFTHYISQETWLEALSIIGGRPRPRASQP